MSFVKSGSAVRTPAAESRLSSAIVLGGFNEQGVFRPTAHARKTSICTGVLIDLYAVSRIQVEISRRRIGDQERVRLSQLATWCETICLGALAGDNPEYDGYWFDTGIGVWRNASDGRRDR